jgi:hypothetical protein
VVMVTDVTCDGQVVMVTDVSGAVVMVTDGF